MRPFALEITMFFGLAAIAMGTAEEAAIAAELVNHLRLLIISLLRVH
jgi:hypothetical protein